MSRGCLSVILVVLLATLHASTARSRRLKLNVSSIRVNHDTKTVSLSLKVQGNKTVNDGGFVDGQKDNNKTLIEPPTEANTTTSTMPAIEMNSCTARSRRLKLNISSIRVNHDTKTVSLSIKVQGNKTVNDGGFVDGQKDNNKTLIEPPTEANTTTSTMPAIEMNSCTVLVSTNICARNTTISLGAELSLMCEVDGYPIPDIHWSKDGVRLKPSARVVITGTSMSQLTVYSMMVNDSGEYVCHASNAISSNNSTAQVTVQDPCKLYPESGYCHSNYSMWYYDENKDQCSQFNYTGCGGNHNRFETREACMSYCSSPAAGEYTTTGAAKISSTPTSSTSNTSTTISSNPTFNFPISNTLTGSTQTSNNPFSSSLTSSTTTSSTFTFSNPTTRNPTSSNVTSSNPTSSILISSTLTSSTTTSSTSTSSNPTSGNPTSSNVTSSNPTSSILISSTLTSSTPTSNTAFYSTLTSSTPSSTTLTFGTPTSTYPTSSKPTFSIQTSNTATSNTATFSSPTSSSPTSSNTTSSIPTSSTPTSTYPTSIYPTSSKPTSNTPTSNTAFYSTLTSSTPSSTTLTSGMPTSTYPTSTYPTSSKPTSSIQTSSNPTSSTPTTTYPTSTYPTSSKPTSSIQTSNTATSSAASFSTASSSTPTSSNQTSSSPTSSTPTSNSPTSSSPTSRSPTSSNPTSSTPTSSTPTTTYPTSTYPTSSKPTSSIQTSNTATSSSPTSSSPTSSSPTSSNPTSSTPTSSTPTTTYPTSIYPTSSMPTSSTQTLNTATFSSPTSSTPTSTYSTSSNPTSSTPTSSTPTTTYPTSIYPTSSMPTSSTQTLNTATFSSPTSSTPTSTYSTSSKPTSSTPTSNTATSSAASFSTASSSTPTSSTPTSSNQTSSSPTSSTPTNSTAFYSSPISSTPTSSTPTSSTPTFTYPTSSKPTSSTPTSNTATSSSPTSSIPTYYTASSSTSISSSPTSRTTTSSTPTITTIALSSTAADDELPESCQVSPELEHCLGAGEVWYLDLNEIECVPHVNSDTGVTCRTTGVFDSQEACERSCGVFRDIDVCRYALDPGQCTNFVSKYYFDGKSGFCKEFIYGGCKGGPNMFSTLGECTQVCNTYIDPCKQYPAAGNCLSRYYMWYYNEASNQCGQFIYTGCGGNRNRFETREECEDQCKHTNNVPIRITTTLSPPPIEPVREQCRTPESLVPCGSNITVFYYDSDSKKCTESNIGGCRHANSYRTEEECERQCGAFKNRNVCEARLDPGSCQQSIPKYYWDSKSGKCQVYAYGGCLGGPNRFSSIDECEEVCGDSGTAAACLQSVDIGEQGPGCGPSIRRWCYSVGRRDCIPLAYQGCGGNQNNFISYEQCADLCKIHRSDPECDDYIEECAQLQCENGVQRTRNDLGCEQCSCIEVDCASHVLACEKLNCYYGMEKYKGADGCERCKCNDHPCVGVSCATGERCVPNAYRDAITQELKFNTECNIVNKSGSCPPEEPGSTEGYCQRLCHDDADCRRLGKCCTRGCSQLCLMPAPSTSPAPATTAYALELPHAPQVLPETEPEVTAAEGGKATLRCLFHSNPPPKITWTRGVITIDGNAGRYRLLSDGALEIVSLYRNDSGVYICVLDNGLGIARQEIRLQVSDPVKTPVNIAGDQNAVVTGELGRPLIIRCLAYGYPEPSVFWHRGIPGAVIPFSNTQYEARGNFLKIKQISFETLGEYACQAYNGVGTPASWSIIVRAYKPVGYSLENIYLVDREGLIDIAPRELQTEATTVPTTSTTPEAEWAVFTVPVNTKILPLHTTISTGAELSLPCEVDGYPEPIIHWTKNGVKLEPSDRIDITGSSVSRLTIYSVTVNDGGEYGCHASNKYSSHYSTAQITVQEGTIPAWCTDDKFFANCSLIVRSKFCNHKYYSKFCCKSCMEAGQFNPQVYEETFSNIKPN